MTGELTHMEKVSGDSAHASEEPREGRAEEHAWPRAPFCSRKVPPPHNLNLSGSDNELPASTVTTPDPRGRSPVRMLTVPGTQAGRELLTEPQRLMINPSCPRPH